MFVVKLKKQTGVLKLASKSKSTSASMIYYQYMQRSKLPTLHFQSSLPRLPIPLLERSCERFLAAVHPILDKDSFADAQAEITEFRHNEGMQLHTLLKQKDGLNKHTSYISEPWFDMYLRDRAPLPLNYNPLLVFKNDTRSEYQTQIVRATNMIISSLRFWKSLRAGLLEPEVFHLNPKKSDTDQFRRLMRLMPTLVATYAAYAFKAFPLDMSQYGRLFGCTRVPAPDKDYLVEHPNSKHILVIRGGNLYAIDVLDINGNILPPHTIMARLQALVKIDKDNNLSVAEHPIGVLTSLNRNAWAKSWLHLCNISSENRLKLENEVNSALFCVCLDGSEDPQYNEAEPQEFLKNFLAGSGKNRWFDKSVSLLVAKDGTAAINFEHSWGDGVAVLRYFNEIYKETIENPFISSKDIAGLSSNEAATVRSIKLNLDDHIKKTITETIRTNRTLMENLNVNMLRYSDINKVFCKRISVSPDSVMQLCFQLAYRQAFSDYVGTYESCSTAAFRHGRTETMRPCTKLTKQFCEAILTGEGQKMANKNELRSIMIKCSTMHGQLTKEAAMGQGFDRHLFALKYLANMENIPIPKFYETKAYRKINHNIISTSTLSSQALMAGSFGPVVPNGLGIGYSILDNECGAIVTSYKDGADGKLFVDSLAEAFDKIFRVMS